MPLAVFAITRIVLLLVGPLAPSWLGSPAIRGNGSVLPADAAPPWLHNLLEPWFRFDTGWYVGVAEHGYHWGSLGEANTNFMPLYPVGIRGLASFPGINPWIAALFVANAAALTATLFLWTWSVRRWGPQLALRVVLIYSFFPFAFFLTTPYAEPLFVALALGAFLLAEDDRWIAATAAAGLCTITRPVGIAVVLGIAALAVSRGERRRAVLACAGIIPLLLFSLYLGLRFGQPLGFLTYHSAGWVHPHGGALNTISSQFHTSLSPFDRLDVGLAFLFLFSGVLVWRRLGAGHGVFVLGGVLLPLVHGLVSMERYVVVLFPAMALWATREGKGRQAVLFALTLLTFLIASAMFAAGYSIF
jgi:hypothetical protein